jgi:site-specific DNA-methyltransferase (adenine-specific)
VLKFSQEAHETGKHDHPTQKPPKLCRVLIRTCSKKGMNLFIPFMGSGTECVEGVNLGLNVTACELDEDYYNAACERIDRETAQQSFL